MVTAPISAVTSTTRSHRLSSALTWVFGLLAGGKKPRARSRHRNIAILVKIKYPAASASSVQRLLCSTHDCTMETASKERSLCSNVPRLSLLWFLFHRLPGPGTAGVGALGRGRSSATAPSTLPGNGSPRRSEKPLQAEILQSRGVIVVQDFQRQQPGAPCQGYLHRTVPLRSTAAWPPQ